jgi:glycosyltransferase involved in cell wall biosynthesis
MPLSALPHLVVFMTDGMSLKAWRDNGLLDRETAIYRGMQPRLASITFVSYGDATDLDLVPAGMTVICNRWRLPQRVYRQWVMRGLPRVWRRPTVVKSNQTRGADVALTAARSGNHRFIARCGYMLSEFTVRQTGEGSPQAEAARALERRVFGAADGVVVTSSAMRDLVVGAYGVEPTRVEVIPNYVDTTAFAPSGSGHGRRVAFVGRLDTQKNPAAMIEAMAGLDAELVVIGDGPLRSQLEDQAQRLGVPAIFHGARPHREIPGLLAGCSVFLLPSFYEGHPKALLEAMAAGLAVVGTDVPGTRDVIEPDRTGLLCGTDAASMRSAVGRLLDDPLLADRLGNAARCLAIDNFSLERIVEAELSLICRLADKE